MKTSILKLNKETLAETMEQEEPEYSQSSNISAENAILCVITIKQRFQSTNKTTITGRLKDGCNFWLGDTNLTCMNYLKKVFCLHYGSQLGGRESSSVAF